MTYTELNSIVYDAARDLGIAPHRVTYAHDHAEGTITIRVEGGDAETCERVDGKMRPWMPLGVALTVESTP